MLLNASVSAATGFVCGALFLGFHPPLSSVPGLAFLVLLGAFACTGLGMLTAAVGLRMRDVPIIANLTMAVLLIFCGVNVPLDKLPSWMRVTAEGLPLTHAIAAARRVADGASLGSVGTSIGIETGLGLAYLVAGLVLLRVFEEQGRRTGSLERA